MRVFKRFSPAILILHLALGQIALPVLRAGSIATQLTTVEKQQLEKETRLVIDLLQNSHYSGRAFREIDNKTMIARFIEELDPQADILSADNVDFIHHRFDHTLKSVYLFRGDLQPAFEIFDLFVAQAKERLDWAQKRLDRGFDFTQDETYSEPVKPTPFKDRQEADRHWELMLKEWVLRERLRGRDLDSATAEVKQQYAEIDRTIASVDSLAIRERFFDSIIRSYDPHSGYFSSDSAREFALEMEKAVIGLGLDLQKEKGQCVVAAVQTGGPADLNSDIAAGDVIEAIAEGDMAWVALDGLRLREIVHLTRGKVGSKIRVAYRPSGTEPRVEVTFERSRIVLGSDRAHGAVSDLQDSAGHARHVGWIYLPSFYSAGENASTTSAARDVRELLEQMNVARLDGLVIDLRGNPGGALNEAAALSELFLSRGVMMLSRGLDGQLREHMIKESIPIYRGLLMILTSENSASASEVFAGAMRYHQRAVVVGAASTFGKGTMQNYIDVSAMAGKEANDWGTLRLTMERFYLPNGQSVQRTGIPAHVIFPNSESPETNRRESELPGAFPEETVNPPTIVSPTITENQTVSDALVKRLNETATRDFTTLPEWGLFRQEQKLWKNYFSRDVLNLNFESRSKEWNEQLITWEAARKTRRALAHQVSFPTEPYEIKAVQAAREIHERNLRVKISLNQSPLPQLRQGSFLVEAGNGDLRKLRLDAIDFQNYSGDTETLADAFSHGAGLPTTSADVKVFLRNVSLLKHRTDSAILAAAQKLTKEPTNEKSIRNGTEALLARLTELDGEMLRDRPALDIPLRESLRLSAEWANWNENSRLH